MNLILASQADSAALNLRDRLLELGDWREDEDFQGTPTWQLTSGDGFCAAGILILSQTAPSQVQVSRWLGPPYSPVTLRAES